MFNAVILSIETEIGVLVGLKIYSILRPSSNTGVPTILRESSFNIGAYSEDSSTGITRSIKLVYMFNDVL